MENTVEEIKKENKKICPICKKEGCSCKRYMKIIGLVLIGVLLGALMTSGMSHNKKRGYGDYKRGYKMEKQQGKMHMMPDGSMMGEMGMQMNQNTGMGAMMMDMTAQMKGKTGKDLEKSFLTEMIPHHQGAVDMARMIIADQTASAELKAFAQNIITAQEKEITQMNEWLKKY